MSRHVIGVSDKKSKALIISSKVSVKLLRSNEKSNLYYGTNKNFWWSYNTKIDIGGHIIHIPTKVVGPKRNRSAN